MANQLNWVKEGKVYRSENSMYTIERLNTKSFVLFATGDTGQQHKGTLAACKARAQQIADEREQQVAEAEHVAAEAEAYANRKNPDAEPLERSNDPELDYGCTCPMQGDPCPRCQAVEADKVADVPDADLDRWADAMEQSGDDFGGHGGASPDPWEPSEADLDHAYRVHGGSRVGGVLAMPSVERRTALPDLARLSPEHERKRSLTRNRIDWGQLRA
jgi:hypothetical protein